MSSPASRRSRRNSQSATPRQTTRSSQAIPGSPLSSAAQADHFNGPLTIGSPHYPTLQEQPAASSPLFYRSSPANGPISNSAGNRTPRPSGITAGGRLIQIDVSATSISSIRVESSPIRYMSSSSPTRVAVRQSTGAHLGSSSSGLFVRSQTSGTPRVPARLRRGDVSSDHVGSDANRRRRLLIDEDGRPVHDEPHSGAATFSNLAPNTSEANALGGTSERIVWGSKVSQDDVKRCINDFLLNYQRKYRMIRDGDISEHDQLGPEHPGQTKEYLEMMKTMLQLGVTSLNLDMKNLKSYPSTIKLWHQFQDFPQDIIPLWDDSIKTMIVEVAEKRLNELKNQRQQITAQNSRNRQSSSVPALPSSDADHARNQANINSDEMTKTSDLIHEAESTVYRVRPFGLDKTINLRDLNPGDIDRIVSIKGLVIRTTPVIPDMKEAFFQCAVCNHTLVVEIDRGKISEPTQCPREACKSSNSMQIVHNRSMFADKQVIKLQETPDNVPDGQTPHSVSLCAYDELVDFCKAGDRIEVTGIFKCNSVRVNPRQRTVKNVYKTFIDVLHIQKVDKRRMGIDVSTIEQELSEHVSGGTEEVRKVTEEEEQRIRATAARPDVYELLSRSLAPSIYEMEDVKKGILLQLFGGTNKSFEKGGNPKYRGDINVLLCGDPSTAKSQLLQYVHKIAPRGVYTSGKGSSAVGLTAYVTRDPETRQLVLESGALVLSDGGVCCIDEFDKMSDSTRSVLHEVMEQQTVSIAKAGIITTLNARTSILASANPIGSKYNPHLPVPQNIDLPPTLLSRFDLVFLVLDRIDEQNDRRMARHLVGMYLEDNPENASSHEILPIEFLTSYISYARAKCQPKITQGASEELVRAYVEMRKLGEDVRAAERRITATTRQLESMIRLAEAHAKMRLAEEVTADDVTEAVRLIKSALKQAATDSRTGLIDMSLLTEGTSASERRRKADLKNAITALLDELTRQGGNVRYSDLAKRLADQSSVQVEAEELSEATRSLQQEGQIQIIGEGARKSIRRVTGV